MNRTIVRTKPQGRIKERKRSDKPVTRPQRTKTRAKPDHKSDGHSGDGKTRVTAPPNPEAPKSFLEAPPEAEATPVPPPAGPLVTDVLARMRQAASAVPDASIAQVEESTGVLRRIISRSLGRGRGMDERERKAVLSMLCDELKPVVLRYELVLEGLSFLERLRFAKSRGAVVSARLNLKGVIASLAAEGAPPEVVEELTRRAQ